MLTDYHVHLENGPYTLDWLSKFEQVSRGAGILELGFSEHGYIFKETSHIFTNSWFQKRQTNSIDDYLRIIEQANSNWNLNIKSGIEMDYLPNKEADINKFIDSYQFDYVIGSIHWLGDWGFDLPEMKHNWESYNIKEIYTMYFELISHMAKTGVFDILGHFDVIKVFGYEPEDFSGHLLSAIETAVKQVKENNMCLELNTAGLRKPVGEVYPKLSWLALFYEAGVPITLSSDAHYPEDVGRDYQYALQLLKQVGYKNIAVFQDRKYKIIPMG